MSNTEEPLRKKTRRRLRVSCVECTRRRQKCDREQPCGLCKSRGVEHLCRWELEPFARPPPARPPASLKGQVTASKVDRQVLYQPVYQRAQSDTQSLGSSPEPPLATSSTATVAPSQPIPAVDHEVKEAAIALAQLSVARQGEYLGTGSLVCALYRLDESDTLRIPHEKSPGVVQQPAGDYSGAVSRSFTSCLNILIAGLPPEPTCDRLVAAFFEKENWRFAIPVSLFQSMYGHMWEVVSTQPVPTGKIKVQWLSLLYAILAHSPDCEGEEERRTFFLRSLSGKRLAEDFLTGHFSPTKMPYSVTEGTAYCCLAAVLLTTFMCDRGQVSEAWKVVGSTIRCAQTAGFHRDPGWNRWKDMTEDEQLLRTTAWHLLCHQDIILSFVLGRPCIIRAYETDVPLPKIPLTAPDSDGGGQLDPVYQACMAHLISIVGDAKEKCLSLIPPQRETVNAADAQFEAWERALPQYLACRLPDTTPDQAYPWLQLQRHNLAIFYYACRMIMHRSLAFISPVNRDTTQRSIVDNHQSSSRSKCIALAIDLLREQRSMLVCLRDRAHQQPYFTSNFLLFEGAITLCIALLKDPFNPHSQEWRDEIKGAMTMLEAIQETDEGDLVRQALLVLTALRNMEMKAADATARPSAQPGLSATIPDTARRGWSPVQESQGALDNGMPGALPRPLYWIEEGLGGTISSFDILHSLGYNTST